MPVLIRGTTTTVDQPPPRSRPRPTRVSRRSWRRWSTRAPAPGWPATATPTPRPARPSSPADDGTIHAHAWTVGFRGDLAFAALIVGGEDSAKTNQIAANAVGHPAGLTRRRPVGGRGTGRRLVGMLRTALKPGRQTPIRSVPASIARPEYVGRTARRRAPTHGCSRRRSSRRCGSPAGSRRGRWRRVPRRSRPGVTTDEIDRVVHEYICDHGAYPSTLGYKHFPKSCCTSLNEVICHGIPDSTVIEDGDIVNIDVTAYIDGVHGDTNATYLAGNVSEENRLLVERTEEALRRAIKAVAPGPAAQRHRPGDRVVRQAVRLRRGPRLHRARHRPDLPLRAGRSCTTTSPA